MGTPVSSSAVASQAVALLCLAGALLPPEADALRFPWQRPKEVPASERVVPFIAEPSDPELILRSQIFLDRMSFGPGKVDGAMGEFTRKAVSLYNRSLGRTDVTNWFFVLEGAEALGPSHTRFVLQEADLRFVDPSLPTEPLEQSEQDYLSYRSLAEFVAERYHTDTNYLSKINPGLNIWSLRPGSTMMVPNVVPFRIEEVETHSRFEAEPGLSSSHVLIDTTERMALFYDEDRRLHAAFPITPGQPQFIPVGTWEVVIMITTPEFRYDKKMLEEGERSKDGTAFMLPPGPNSPVGMIWAGLDKSGIGLHGTASPRTIGRSRSAGCVRFANWDALRLPGLIRPGATVEVR